MFENLLTELLIEIHDYLWDEDWINFNLVCKKWSRAFYYHQRYLRKKHFRNNFDNLKFFKELDLLDYGIPKWDQNAIHPYLNKDGTINNRYPNDHMNLFGGTGTGKSTLLGILIEDILYYNPNYVFHIFSPLNLNDFLRNSHHSIKILIEQKKLLYHNCPNANNFESTLMLLQKQILEQGNEKNHYLIFTEFCEFVFSEYFQCIDKKKKFTALNWFLENGKSNRTFFIFETQTFVYPTTKLTNELQIKYLFYTAIYCHQKNALLRLLKFNNIQLKENELDFYNSFSSTNSVAKFDVLLVFDLNGKNNLFYCSRKSLKPIREKKEMMITWKKQGLEKEKQKMLKF